MDINILQGKIIKIEDTFVHVELYHILPLQTIKALKIMPMFIDSREQEMNIKIGTEVLLLGWGINSLNNYAVLGSTNNGISIDGREITKIENLNSVQLIAPNISISNNLGDRGEINSKLSQAEKLYLWVKNILADAISIIFNTKDFEVNSDKTIFNTKDFEVNSDKIIFNTNKIIFNTKDFEVNSDKTSIVNSSISVKNDANFELISLIGDLMTNVVKLEGMHDITDTIQLKAKLETFK